MGPCCAAAVVALLAVVWAAAASAARRDAALAGVWSGEAPFLARAGLRAFELFVGPPAAGPRAGYLHVVAADGRVLADAPVRLAVSGAASAAAAAWSGDPVYRAAARVEGGGAALPGRVELALRPAAGALALAAGGRALAELARDPAASAAALAEYAA